MKSFSFLLATLGLLGEPLSAVETNLPHAPAAPFPVSISVDLAKPLGQLRPIWRYFGADEPNYAYMKDGKKLLAALGELAPKQV